MTQKPLYRTLNGNLAFLEKSFGRSDDFYPKHLMIAGIPCAIAMFTGNHGAGTQTFIILIFAVSTCLFAPNFINIIKGSAGGATIFGLL